MNLPAGFWYPCWPQYYFPRCYPYSGQVISATRKTCLSERQRARIYRQCGTKMVKENACGYALYWTGQPLAEWILREFQFDIPDHLSGSLVLQFFDWSSSGNQSMAGRIQHSQATWIMGGMNPERFLQCWSEVNLNPQPEILTGWVDQRSWACQRKKLLMN